MNAAAAGGGGGHGARAWDQRRARAPFHRTRSPRTEDAARCVGDAAHERTEVEARGPPAAASSSARTPRSRAGTRTLTTTTIPG